VEKFTLKTPVLWKKLPHNSSFTLILWKKLPKKAEQVIAIFSSKEKNLTDWVIEETQ
jgi:hypothetical protein